MVGLGCGLCMLQGGLTDLASHLEWQPVPGKRRLNLSHPQLLAVELDLILVAIVRVIDGSDLPVGGDAGSCISHQRAVVAVQQLQEASLPAGNLAIPTLSKVSHGVNPN